MTFDAFQVMRRIRDDQGLSSTQKLILLTAVLRADNNGQVRASQGMLAKDTGLNLRTVEKALASDQVAIYFDREKAKRRTILTFNTEPGPGINTEPGPGMKVIPEPGPVYIRPQTGMNPNQDRIYTEPGPDLLPSSTSSSTNTSTRASAPTSPAERRDEVNAMLVRLRQRPELLVRYKKVKTFWPMDEKTRELQPPGSLVDIIPVLADNRDLYQQFMDMAEKDLSS